MIALGAGHCQMTTCQAPDGQVVASFLRSDAGIAEAAYVLAPSGRCSPAMKLYEGQSSAGTGAREISIF
jgi:hypothetical protein